MQFSSKGMRRGVAAAVMFGVLAACAAPTTKTAQGSKAVVAYEEEKQREFVVREVFRAVDRLDRLSWPIRLANAELCDPDHRKYLYGFTTGSIQTFSREYQLAAQRALGLDASIRIQRVNPGSPAEYVGFLPGDEIVGVDGEPLTAKMAKEFGKRISEQPRVIFTVSRDGVTNGPVDVAVNGVLGCSYSVNYVDGSLNAYADGSKVYVTREMEAFVRDDEEMSMVIAHEFAHNIMEHTAKKRGNALAGSLLGFALDMVAASQGVNLGATRAMGAAGAQMHSVEFEQEADYVAMYMLARSGVQTKGVSDLWRRMSALHPQGIDKRGSHPSNAERFVAIDLTHEEIQEKLTLGAPLLPNMKQEGAERQETSAEATPTTTGYGGRGR